jgi:Zn-finger nucleic acid-binding protein
MDGGGRLSYPCPKCGAMMKQVVFEGLEIDRCTNCAGIWFDWNENIRLRDMRNSEQIDTGRAEVGKMLNPIAEVDCPLGHGRMIPMVDQEQPHIWYECCPVCYGIFLDAGEFRDYKTVTIVDVVRGWLAKDRI